MNHGEGRDPQALVRSKNSAHVREMFNSIARRYDLANHLLSAGIDHRWRRRARKELAALFPDTRPAILDVCCGTGDLSLELSPLGPVVGVDFARDMLGEGQRKVRDRRAGGIAFVEADGLQLPFRDASFDVVSAAFGVRNFEQLETGLAEMARVLRPGGVAAILEFSQPHWPGFAPLFRFYFRHILPRIGGALTGHTDPYRYLPASVESFADPAALARILEANGLTSTRAISLTGGVATLLLAHEPQGL